MKLFLRALIRRALFIYTTIALMGSVQSAMAQCVPASQAQIFAISNGTVVSIQSGTLFNADSLTLLPASNFILTNNSLNLNLTPTNTTPNFTLPRVYAFGSTTNAFSGSLFYRYQSCELNTLTESNLRLSIDNGSSWVYFANSTNDIVNNAVSNTSLSNLLLKELTLGTCVPSTAAVIVSDVAEMCKGYTTNLRVNITGGIAPFTVVYSDGSNNFTLNNYQSGTPIAVSPSQTKTYTLVSVTSDVTFCSGTGFGAPVVLTINNFPTIEASNGGTVCEGSSLLLSSTATSGSSFKWEGPNGFTSTAQNPTIANAALAAEGLYSVEATLKGCTSYKDYTYATLNKSEQVFAVNQTTTLAVTAGTLFNADKLTIEPAASFAISNNVLSRNLTTTNASTYNAIKRVYKFSSTTNSFSGNIFNNYQDCELNGLFENNLSLGVHNGTAWLLYTNSIRDSISNTVTDSSLSAIPLNELFLWDCAPATPTITAGGATNFCSGGSVVLTASAGTTYLWSNGATTQAITVTTAGSYTVRITNANGCQSAASAEMVVTINAVPSVTAGSRCGTGTVALSATPPSGATIAWFSTATLGTALATTNAYTTPSIAVSTTYYAESQIGATCKSATRTPVLATVNALPSTPTITAGSATNFCSGGSVVLTASAGTTYLWSNGATTQAITVTTSGSYTVQVTNASGCQSAASATTVVTVNALPSTPTITAGGTTTFCSGGNVVLTASAGTTYLWSNGATTQAITVTTAGSYTVRVTNASGCQSAASAATAVTVNALPTTPTITAGSATTFCSGGSVVLTASAGTTYLWSNGATTQAITVTTTGSYTVRVTNASGCQSAASVATAVTVNALPSTPTITAGGATTFCSGGSVVLTASAGTTYLWSNGATTQAITVTTAGSYTVQVTNNNGCQSAASVATVVTITPTVTINVFSPATSTRCQGASTVTTTTSASNSTGITYSLDATTAAFAGNSINASTGAVTYAAGWSGTTTITASAAGCSGPVTTTHVVTTTPTVGTPTAITVSAGSQPTCQLINGTSTTTYATTATNSTGFNWSLSNASAGSINATTGLITWANGFSGSVNIQVTASGCNGPSSQVTRGVTITPTVTINVFSPATSTRCQGAATVTTTTSASNSTGITYSLDATTAAFAGNSINASTGAVTYAVGWSGTTTITASAAGCNGPVTTTHVVTVSPASVGGTIAGSATVCTGTNSTALTLSGHTGSVTKWQSSTSSTFTSAVTDVANTTTTLTASNLTVTTYYRAVITSGACAAVNSATATVTVSSASVGGTIAGSATVCTGTNSTALTLSGHTGAITRWESSLDNFATAGTSIANTTTTLTANNLTATTYYKAVITSGVCAAVNSATATVTVSPVSVGGTIAGGATVCTGSNSTALTLSGHTGAITRWESSLDNFATAGTSIANTTTSLTATNLTATTYYRAVITSGACAAANSASAIVTVSPVSVGGTIAGSATVCTGTNSTALTLSGNTSAITRWESSTSSTFASAVTSITNSTTSLTATNLTATTYYRAVITSGACAAVNSAIGTITVNALPTAPSITAGGATTFCSGGSVVLTAATLPVTDLSFTTISSGNSSVEYWQSFTPTIAGTTTGIQVQLNGATNSTVALDVYTGIGIGGTLLYSNNAVPIAGSGGSFATLTLPDLNLSVGSNYTFRLTGVSFQLIINNSTYGTGYSTNYGSSYRLNFKTIVTPTLGSVQWYLGGVTIPLATSTAYNATATGNYTAKQTNDNGCQSAASASMAVTVNINTAGAASNTPTLCVNTALTNITHATTGATGIGTATGLPAGVTAAWAANTITISGTPGVSGTFNYSIPLTGGCGSVNATGTITVSPASVGGTIAGSATVCTGTNSTALTLSGHTGAITRWESSLDNFATAGTSIANTTTSLTASNLTATTYYRAVITSGACAAANSASAIVTVSPVSVGGTIAGSATVCNGTNSTALSLSGHTGSVTKWQSSTSSTFASAVTDVANTTTTLTASNLTVTTYYRAVITSGACAAVNSATSTVTVSSASVGGTIAGSATVCTGTNSTALTLSGHTGAITRWESSLDNFVTAGTSIANTTTTLTAANLIATTYYRAIITNSVCAASNSATATVTVSPVSVGGTIAGGATVCTSTNSTALTLSGHTESVTKWQSSTSSTFASAVTDVANTTTTLTATNLTATTYYRAVITSGACAAANSASAIVTVSPVSVGGTIAGSATVCTGTNSTALTLSGHTGAITRWESSTSSTFASAVTSITNSTTSLTASNLTATTYYRAVITSGACAAVNSAIGTITVNALPTAPSITAGGATTFCSGGSVALTAATLPVTDLSFTTISSGNSSVEYWQSFTPTIAGTTTGIQVQLNGATNSTVALDVYTGIGIGGTLLYSNNAVPIAGSGGSFATLTLPDLNLSVGSNYTFRLTGVSFQLIINNGTYGTGYSTNYGSSYRLNFKTIVTPTLGSVQWYLGGVTIPLATSTAYNATATGNYTAKQTNDNGCQSAASASTAVTVNINTAGAASNTPTLCVNTALTNITHATTGATGIGTATGLPAGVTAAWAANTITISGTPTASGTFNYSIPLTGGCGSVNATGTITVSPASVGGTIAGSATVCTGTNSTALTLSGHTGAITRWESSLDNFASAGTSIANTTTSLTASNLTATTYFRAVITSGACAAANSASAIVTVSPVSVGGTIAGSATVCTGTNSTALTLSGHTGTITRWESSLDNFVTAGTSIANTTTSLTATNLTATTYYRAVITSGACTVSNSATAIVTVNALPTAPISGNTSFCTGGNTVLNSNATAGSGTISSYQWQVGGVNVASGGTSATYTATAAGSYTVTVTNSNGCSFSSSSYVVSVNANYTITASAGTNGSISSTGVTTMSCDGTGDKTYTITPNAGYLISDVTVDGISATALTTGSYAAGGTYVFTDVQVNHTISVNFALACTNVGLASATATASSICANATTTLTYAGLTGSNASVTWWSNSNGTGTSYGTGTPSSAVSPGTYYAYATGNCGTAVAIPVTVGSKVNIGLASATATAPSICTNTTTTLTYSGLTGTNASVTWTQNADGTGTTYGNGTPSIAVGPGTYNAYATGDCGSPVSMAVTVAITPNSVHATSITACGKYTWNGVEYTASGLYTGTTTNCVTEKLNLTITPKPTEPTLACYETATFNPTTCTWEVTGTQPVMPTLACYQSATFNTTSCSWDVTGTQPAKPTLACYETATFNPITCVWDITGTQPAKPTLACYQSATFNTTSCSWDVTGTQPATPTLACYQSATFNTTSCSWDVTGTQPGMPTLACYQSATFNTTSCSWDVTGTQPGMPTLACYETATFNPTTCVWDITGTQPSKPTLACYETATFNPTTCIWDITGTQPAKPTLACYETASFNTTTCGWVVTGSPITGSFGTTVCGSYLWNGTAYSSSGTYTWIGKSVKGCDSTVTLNLIIKQPTSSAITASACDSYAWKGTTYTTSGAKTWTGTNAAGCDSVVTLNLTITASTSNTTTISACDSYTWPVNGTVYTASGTYTSVSGCHTETLNLTILASPSVPVTVGGASCGTGTVSLSATSASGAGLAWYSSATSTTLLSTGSVFTTPTLNANTTYYVAATRSGCSSARTAVGAVINAIPDMPAGTNATVCGSGVVTLGANPGAGSTIDWYSAATNGTLLSAGSAGFSTPSLGASTTYYAQARNTTTGCVSARTGVTATLLPLPAEAGVSGATLCGSGAVTLTATVAAGMAADWYSAAVGGSLLQSGASSYTTGVLTETTTFYVQSRNTTTGCLSATRTAVKGTINITPAPAVTGGSNCGAGTVTLSAVAPSGTTLAWFAVASGGTGLGTAASYTTPSLTTSTTYYVEARNSTCISARAVVTATILPVLASPTVTGASRCGSGSVTLGAATSVAGASLQWLATASSTAVLGTGTSFTSEVLTASKTYYVAATTGATCRSAAVAVTATVNLPLAAPGSLTGTTNICSVVGTATLTSYTALAVRNAVSYKWTLPAGAVVSGSSTGNIIKLKFNSAASSAKLGVQAIASNGCEGNKLEITLTGCAAAPLITSAQPAVMSIALDSVALQAYLFPNPSQHFFTLRVQSSSQALLHLRVLDLAGREIKQWTTNPANSITFGRDLKPGAYFVELLQGNTRRMVKAVKL